MNKYYYILHIQYLGFRFHGWQKQPNLKTVHMMIDKTVNFVLNHDDFKTLGTSRTDAMVSANHSAFELFLKSEIEESSFMDDMNRYLPTDIKVLSIEKTDSNFNIINSPRIKEYIYLFSFGEKSHPFSASMMTSFTYDLDIETMKKGAKLFLGEHHFKKYCTKPSENTNLNRTVLVSEIIENNLYQANFFPETSYIFRIKSKGFMRNQVRLIMGQLLELGRGNTTLDNIKNSLLENNDGLSLRYIAPPSGLILNEIEFL